MTPKRRRRRSTRSEQRGADSLGGKRVPGSGALLGAPGDFITNEILGEDKWTSSNVFYITRSLWEDLEGKAKLREGRTPVFRVTTSERIPMAILRLSDMRKLFGDSELLENEPILQRRARIPVETSEHVIDPGWERGPFVILSWRSFTQLMTGEEHV